MSKAVRSDAPLSVGMLLYVLELVPTEKNGPSNWYIGVSYALNNRIAQHASGRGSAWTRLHPVVRVAEVHMNASLVLERQVTLQYMRRHGWQHVRGGPYSSPHLPRAPKALEAWRRKCRKLTSYAGVVRAAPPAVGRDTAPAASRTDGSVAACESGSRPPPRTDDP
jgi:predicted GIY-YIG superfamily endonuclease